MIIRFFGAAKAAAGVEEQTLPLPAGGTLADVLALLVREHPVRAPAGAPALPAVLARSSFLRNETALKDHAAVLDDRDVIDILPPFAGG
ncbi:MoaD/ThiS family protein [Arthrobacter deserti]|uniref:MoaD/ThiS family protein n=1 Tax=Arthrobacter deserti TaxID=1742687 RepID=A0ABX1JLX6_9MICC|nr:MoaD/ThiS family protein [Arthrobacter deserti]